MNFIEKAAFEIFKNRDYTVTTDSPEVAWNKARGTVVGRRCIADAIAAARAFRNPTVEMGDAFMESDGEGWISEPGYGEEFYGNFEEFAEAWGKAIDAAIAGEEV